MTKPQLISKNLERFYEEASEETRLNSGLGTLEFERNKALISQYLPSSAGNVLDVGGGTGKYAKWLSKKGHSVHLVDPIKKHIKRAEKRAKKLDNPFEAILGEARNLPFENAFADVVILHGPLYHLQKSEERAAAIIEAKRVLKPGGILLGFAINYTASTLVGLWQGLIHDPAYNALCKEELTTGLHNPPEEFLWLLTEAYYHNPSALRSEVAAQGFDVINTHAVEGMAWLDANYFVNMADETKRKNLLDLVSLTETDPNLLAFSPHLMIAGKKS